MKTLLNEHELRAGVAALATTLTAEYRGRPLTVLGVLKGGLIFLADLIRQLDFPLRVGVVQASSYRGDATTPGPLTLNSAGLPDLAGRDVLLIDDIYDTGRTLEGLGKLLRPMRPRTLRSAVLLWKSGRQQVAATPDYYCFHIPDVFVVGYGLDHGDDHRHLPYVAALQPGDAGDQ